MVSDIYVGSDGNLHKVIGGADTVLPFRSGSNFLGAITTCSTQGYNASLYVITLENGVTTGKVYQHASNMVTTDYFKLQYPYEPNVAAGYYGLEILKDCIVNDKKYTAGQVIKWKYDKIAIYLIRTDT